MAPLSILVVLVLIWLPRGKAPPAPVGSPGDLTANEPLAEPGLRGRPGRSVGPRATAPPGSPPADVRVIVRSIHGEPLANAEVVAVAVNGPAHAARGRTSTEGEAVLSDLAAVAVRVTATGPGHCPEAEVVALNETSRHSVVMLVWPAESLAGTVQERGGTPIGGARVDARRVPVGEVTATVADGAGVFFLSLLASGPNAVRAARAEGPWTDVGRFRIPAIDQLDIVLPAAVVLEGRVIDIDGGDPIAGALVRAATGWGTSDVVSARTDDRGEYRVLGLSDGSGLSASTWRRTAGSRRRDPGVRLSRSTWRPARRLGTT